MDKANNNRVTRKGVLELLNNNVLQGIQSLWNLEFYKTDIYPQYDGCQNLVFYLTKNKNEFVLRISFREDRNLEQIQAETHFIDYLHSNGVLVAYPIRSKNGTFVESIRVGDFTLYCVLFIKAEGFRLPDKNYQYREGIPIDEYFHNFGKTLGLMHKLTKTYSPINDTVIRHDLVNNMDNYLIPKYLPKDKNIIKSKFDIIIKESRQLPKNNDAFGLIHADFGDGNFVINYDNGNITVFDFDDSAYCWFMYDIADAWTKGMGWAIFESGIKKRKYIMENWHEKMLKGYSTENTINDYWLSQLPYFLKMIEMEALINEYRNSIINGECIEENDEMNFRIECIEKDIPYFGLFDKIYNHEHPFCLV
jgi:Ser/Thr protein kinase RdoA (MazF antagonist)